jgi:hypothetical protein
MPPVYAYIATIDGYRALTDDERVHVDAFVAWYLTRTSRLPDGSKKVYGFGRVFFTEVPLLGEDEKEAWQ